MIKRFKKYIKENLAKKSLVESLELLLFEEFSNSAINQLKQKFGEDSLPLINQFDSLRSANRQEVKGIDIFNFKSKEDLNKFLASVPESKTKKEKVAKSTGSELVYENDQVGVYLIKTKNACISYGANTKWCITSADAKHWESYTDKGVSFYFILRKDAKGDQFDKVAVARYPEVVGGGFEIYDAKDNLVNQNKILKMFNLNDSIFKEWVDPTAKFVTFENKKIKYTEENGMRVFGNIDLSNLGISKLPDFGTL